MKVTVDVDMTPDEARRLLGLPDLAPLHARYLAMMAEAMGDAARPDAVEAMLRSWAPAGDAGLLLWRQMFAGGTASGGTGSGSGSTGGGTQG